MGTSIKLAINYDQRKGWESSNPGWHTHAVNLLSDQTIYDLANQYNEILDWLYENIDKCEYHCRWTINLEERKMYVRFRYEKDYLRFALTW